MNEAVILESRMNFYIFPIISVYTCVAGGRKDIITDQTQENTIS